MTDILCPVVQVNPDMSHVFVDVNGNYMAEQGVNVVTIQSIDNSCYFNIIPKDTYYIIKSNSGKYLCEQNTLPQWTDAEANAKPFRFTFQDDDVLIQIIGVYDSQSAYLRVYNNVVTFGSYLDDDAAHFNAYALCDAYDMQDLDVQEKIKLCTAGDDYIGWEDVNYFIQFK